MNNLNETELGVWNDIKNDYINYLKVGLNNNEASDKIIFNNSDLFNSDYSNICWLSLANVQWEYGRLEEKNMEKALNIAFNNKKYEELYDKLSSKQPPQKKVTRIKAKTPLWNVGSIIEYTINNLNSKWNGKKIFFKVEAIGESNIGTLPPEEFIDRFSIFKIFNVVSNESLDYSELKKIGYFKNYYSKEKKDIRFIAFYNSERDKKSILCETNIVYRKSKTYNNKHDSLCGASFIDLKKDTKILCDYIDDAFYEDDLIIR